MNFFRRQFYLTTSRTCHCSGNFLFFYHRRSFIFILSFLTKKDSRCLLSQRRNWKFIYNKNFCMYQNKCQAKVAFLSNTADMSKRCNQSVKRFGLVNKNIVFFVALLCTFRCPFAFKYGLVVFCLKLFPSKQCHNKDGANYFLLLQ